MIGSIERLARRMLLVIGRGRVQMGDDSGPVQLLQVVFGALETHDNLKRAAEFGFTSMPPKNCDCIAVFIAGDRSNGVVIATNDQTTRFKNLKTGESALYNAFGMSVYLSESGVVIDGGSQPITVNNAKGITINSTDDVTLNMSGDVTLNMGGKNVTINGPGAVVLGPAGKAVVMDGDPVSGNVVHASQSVVKI